MQTLTSFDTLIEQARSFADNKHDSVVDVSRLHFNEVGHAIVPNDLFGGGMELGMEDLAISQLGGRLGSAFWDAPKRTVPTDVYRQMARSFPDHFAGLTNDLLHKSSGKLLIRGYGDNVRAVLSDSYAKLDNAELLDMASQVLDGVPYEIVRSGQYYSRNDGVQRDEMSVRVVIKNVKPDDEPGGYGLGVMIRNGETGGSASEVRPLVMRTTCLNSLVFKTGANGEEMGMRLLHRGSRVAKINLLAAAIGEALPMAAEGLDKFLSLKTQQVDLQSIIGKLGEEYGWSEEVKMKVGIGSEGHQSVYGLVNGLTFAANQVDQDTSSRLDMETLAAMFVRKPALLPR